MYTQYRPAHNATGEHADLFFETDAWQGEPRNMEPEKCDEVGWFALEALPENIVGYLRIAIAAVDNGTALSEPGWDK